MASPAVASQSCNYADYAAVYDRTGQIRFSILMEMYLREALRRHEAPGARMLDLACGTGTLALMQAENGWEVIGLDHSSSMLVEARKKQRISNASVSFVEGDMRNFTLDHPVDLVTCFYDSLNYLLSPDELLACFRSVAHALAPAGLFCFDLATDYFLRTYWQGTESFHDDGYTQVMESHFDEEAGHSTLVLTGVFETEDGGRTSFQEVHVERSYLTEEVNELLRMAGLVPEALYDCFSFGSPTERSLRQFWVARNGSEATCS